MQQTASTDGFTVLSAKDREELLRWMRSQRIQVRLALRANIIWCLFACDMTPSDVAKSLGVSVKTVRKWQDRYIQEGIAGLFDRPRSGRPGVFDVGQRCEVIALACDDPAHYGYPEGLPWTLDHLTETARMRIEGPPMSRSSIHRTLTTGELHPHRIRMWLHSPDPRFKEKVNEVVQLYLAPPEGAVVLCVDEKTGIQALERRYETRQALPGRMGRREFEYVRHGTTSLIAAFNVQTGEVLGHLGPTRTADDLLAFMDEVAQHYDQERKIIVIWDNLNIHLEGASQRWTAFNARHQGRFEFHYTPIHASWVNQVEVFFSILEKRTLHWRNVRSVAELEQGMAAFIRRWNEVDGHPFHWTFRGYPLESKAA
jgi:transposase